MTGRLRLANADQVRQAVAWAVAKKEPLEIVGNGSKRGLGRPVSARHRLDLGHLAAVSLYEPEELVLTAGAGTELVEIEALLARHSQELAFEPPDLAPLLGSPSGATLGGIIACNLSGPRRIKAGAARDHFLGVKGVSGRGEAFRSGGRVVKNVTGYDMAKLLAGSFGTLAVMTEITVKVMPAAESVCTIALSDLDDATAVAALGTASRTPYEPSGLAHLPQPVAAHSAVSEVSSAGTAITAVRVEGPSRSVADRSAALGKELASVGATTVLDDEASRVLWREIRDVNAFAAQPDRVVWRLSVPPAAGADVVAEIGGAVACMPLYDWAGGLIWLALDPGIEAAAETVRAAVATVGGHALLFRARADIRRTVAVFQPQAPELSALSARIKDGFDPKRILNPGRMYADV